MRRLPLISTLFPYTTLFRSDRSDSKFCVRPVRDPPFHVRHSKAFLINDAAVFGDQDRTIQLTKLLVLLQQSIDLDRKSTRLNSSHLVISYAVFCLKKKKNKH